MTIKQSLSKRINDEYCRSYCGKKFYNIGHKYQRSKTFKGCLHVLF